MTFLAPLTLLSLVLVGLPIAIHMLVRRRATRLRFPSLEFLSETKSFKLHLRRVRQPLLLALRVAAIVLLVLGLARPLFTASRKTETVHFVLLDASSSMRVAGRTEAAREQARIILNEFPAGERVAIISFSSTATPLVALSSHRDELLAAIERYQPGPGLANYEAAAREIQSQLAIEPYALAKVALVSDFQESGLSAAIVGGEQVQLTTFPVGADTGRNAFLIDERVANDASGIKVAATDMVAQNDGRRGLRRSWLVDTAAGERDGIEWRTESNGQVTGRLTTLEPDDFDLDDARFFAFAPPHPSSLLLLAGESDARIFLTAALEASRSGVEEMITLESRQDWPTDLQSLERYSLIAIDVRRSPSDAEARTLIEYARNGGTVLAFLSRDLDTEFWNRLASSPAGADLPFEQLERIEGSMSVDPTDVAAPSLHYIDDSVASVLRGLHINAGYALKPKESTDVLFRWTDQRPALTSANVGAGRIMVLGTSPESSSGDLGASTAFPSLVASIVRAAVKTGEPASIEIGQTIRLNVPPDTVVQVASPRGQMSQVSADGLARDSMAYFSEPGIYKLNYAGKETFLALNSPVSESEPRLARGDTFAEFQSSGQITGSGVRNDRAAFDAQERSGSMWRYLLVAAFLFLLAEFVYALRMQRLASPSEL